MPDGFWCSCCGEWHDGLPMAYRLPVPESILGAPDDREGRVYLDDDLCAVRETETFLVRGHLEIPVADSLEPFAYTVWVSLSEANFQRTVDLWQTAGRESEPPYFGWLINTIPAYPETALLKTNMHTQSVGLRPLIELDPTDHPLAVEQREGITMARVQEIAERLLHPSKSSAT